MPLLLNEITTYYYYYYQHYFPGQLADIRVAWARLQPHDVPMWARLLLCLRVHLEDVQVRSVDAGGAAVRRAAARRC